MSERYTLTTADTENADRILWEYLDSPLSVQNARFSVTWPDVIFACASSLYALDYPVLNTHELLVEPGPHLRRKSVSTCDDRCVHLSHGDPPVGGLLTPRLPESHLRNYGQCMSIIHASTPLNIRTRRWKRACGFVFMQKINNHEAIIYPTSFTAYGKGRTRLSKFLRVSYSTGRPFPHKENSDSKTLTNKTGRRSIGIEIR